MENEEDYVRVVPTSSGNNGGNKIKLWTGIQGRIACESERETERERERERASQTRPLSFKMKQERKGEL